MPNPSDVLKTMIQRNPQIQNNPMAQNFIGILQSGDSKRGEEVANNLLSTYGMTKEQAMNQVRNFFHF